MDAGGAFAHCRRLIAEHDKDRYWASLYAPAARRDALFALYAFDAELAAVHQRVRDPMAGEIRLQWWREVLDGGRAEEAAAHPVAAAILASVQTCRLPAARLIALIDARVGDLYDDPIADLEDYGAATYGTVVALAAQILGGWSEPVEHITRHAGLARLYAEAERRQEARAHLDAAEALLPDVPADFLPALLPAATIGPSLGGPLPRWRRLWLIWRAARDPRRIFR